MPFNIAKSLLVLLILSFVMISNTNCFSQDTTKTSTEAIRQDTGRVVTTEELAKEKPKNSSDTPSDSLPKKWHDKVFPKLSHPGKAALFSAIVPGAALGQIYNRKYWKVPIAWVLMGTSIYLAYTNAGYYNDAVKVYQANPTSPLASRYLSEVNYYRKNRDMFILCAGISYVLTIVDAYVDAHLMEFEVKDDLSVRVMPNMIYTPNTGIIPGLSVNFSFKAKNENRSSWIR